jgi:flagellar basal body rod protein FlgF
MKHHVSLAFLLALGAGGSLALAAPGTVTKDSELRSSPAIDASPKGTVASQAKVDIVATKGGWVQIKTADGKTGWLRLMNVKPAEAKGSGGSLKGLALAGNVARTGSTGSTATTGVKGISKEDLAGAKPNFGELGQLDRYRASPAEGQQHARSAGLRAQDVAALPAGN